MQINSTGFAFIIWQKMWKISKSGMSQRVYYNRFLLFCTSCPGRINTKLHKVTCFFIGLILRCTFSTVSQVTKKAQKPYRFSGLKDLNGSLWTTLWCLESDSNRHGHMAHEILSLGCLPIPPSRQVSCFYHITNSLVNLDGVVKSNFFFKIMYETQPDGCATVAVKSSHHHTVLWQAFPARPGQGR